MYQKLRPWYIAKGFVNTWARIVFSPKRLLYTSMVMQIISLAANRTNRFISNFPLKVGDDNVSYNLHHFPFMKLKIKDPLLQSGHSQGKFCIVSLKTLVFILQNSVFNKKMCAFF